MDQAQARFLYTTTLKILDAAAVWAAWIACWYLRFYSSWVPVTKGMPEYQKYSSAGLPIALVFSAVFHMVGAYRANRIEFGFRSLLKMMQGCIVGTLVAIACLYFAGEVHYSRIYLVLFMGCSVLAIGVVRLFTHLLWQNWRKRFVQPIRSLLVGSSDLLGMYIRMVNERRPYPVTWIGRLGAKEISDRTLSQISWCGDETRLLEIIEKLKPDRVILSFSEQENTDHADLLDRLSQELVEVRVLPDFGKFSTFTFSADHEGGIPILLFNQNPMGGSDRAIKRAIDLVGAACFLTVFSPLYLAIAIAVRATSRGPVFYSQERVGADGRRFMLYKFRSMRLDAEATTGAVWAVKGDDRTTPLGKWLRKTSLDEFPQFYNVLKGEMSLVGPRPERPVFVEKFRKEVPKYMLRHKVKSGITGWAQINGWRGNTSIDERIKHDLYYIGHWSHLLDVKILLLTLVRGFVNHHAY